MHATPCAAQQRVPRRACPRTHAADRTAYLDITPVQNSRCTRTDGAHHRRARRDGGTSERRESEAQDKGEASTAAAATARAALAAKQRGERTETDPWTTADVRLLAKEKRLVQLTHHGAASQRKGLQQGVVACCVPLRRERRTSTLDRQKAGRAACGHAPKLCILLPRQRRQAGRRRNATGHRMPSNSSSA